jgi:hypothetical protein
MLQLQPTGLPTPLLVPIPVKALQPQKPSASLVPEKDVFVRQVDVRVGGESYEEGLRTGALVALGVSFVLEVITSWNRDAKLKQALTKYEKDIRLDEQQKLKKKRTNSPAVSEKTSVSVSSSDGVNNTAKMNGLSETAGLATLNTTNLFQPVVNNRSGFLGEVLGVVGKSGVVSGVAGSTSHFVIAALITEFMIKEILSKAKTEVDTPDFFKAYEELAHAKRLLDAHTGGFDDMSPAIQKGYRTALDRATTLFREAKGGLKEEAKLLRPIYMLHEIVALLMNGNREEALIAANGVKTEYLAQKPLFEKLDKRYTSWSESTYNMPTPIQKPIAAFLNLFAAMDAPILEEIVRPTINNLGGKVSAPSVYDARDAAFDAAYRPHIVELYKRMKPYYEGEYKITSTGMRVLEVDKHVEYAANRLLNLSSNDAIFKLLPPKK